MVEIYQKISDLDILPEDPWENDVLDREEEAENLTNLISSISQPFVLSINSPWGTGKTTFVKMWHQDLINKEYPCIYFSAWESDFEKDPLVALLGELEASITTLVKDVDDKNRKKKLGEKLEDIIKKAAPFIAKGLVKKFTSSDEASEFTEKYVKNLIGTYEEQKNSLDEIRDTLKELVDILNEGRDDKLPLIFFIDELDRCRPTYAIELLERVKHLFNVPGIVFVLSIDIDQLSQSVKTIYGTGMNANGYLRRFFDLGYNLKEPDPEKFCNLLIKKFDFAKNQKNRLAISFKDEIELVSDIQETAQRLIRLFNPSLRVIIHLFERLNIVVSTTSVEKPLFIPYLIFLLMLKSVENELYVNFNQRRTEQFELKKVINDSPGGKSFLNDKTGTFIDACIDIAHLTREEKRAFFLKMEKKYNDKGHYDPTFDQYFNRLMAIEEFLFDPRDYIVAKIELAENFDLT